MAFVRCYTGTDGQSHFEDLDLLPPDIERSIGQAASSISFTRSPNGRFSEGTMRRVASTPFSSPGARWRSRSAMGPRGGSAPESRPVRRPHGTRAHQPERRWGPPDRYRALGGLASSRGSCTPWRRIMICIPKTGLLMRVGSD